MSSSTTSSDGDARAFLRWWLGPLALLLLGAGVLSFLVDANTVFGHGFLPALDDHRVNDSRIAKAERLSREAFDVVLFGSSRTHLGLDPRDTGAPSGRAYNAGVPMTTFDEIADLAQLMLSSGHVPRTTFFLVQLDLFTDPHGSQARRLRSRLDPAYQRAEYLLDHILSYAAAQQSLNVLQASQKQPPDTRYNSSDGKLRFRTPPDDIRSRFTRNLKRAKLEGQHQRYSPRTMERFKRLVAKLCAAGASVRVAIAPVHALQLELWWQEGRAAHYDEMLRALSRLPPDPGSDCGQVVDFSGFLGIHSEAVPTAEETDLAMRHYYDDSHFNERVGAAVLGQLLPDAPQRPVPGLTGYPLSPDTVEADIERVHEEQRAYADGHVDELAWLRALQP